MLTFKYYAYYRNSKDIYDTRVKMVRYAKEQGNKPAAREFATTVKTVRKWVRRFEQSGKSALQDRSRKPRNSPASIKPYWKFKILGICKELKENEKSATGALLRRKHNIPYSLPTVLKVMREGGYGKLRKRRAQRNRDLREKKRELKAFEKIQVDVKYLNDIPEMELERRVFELPQYQFSARCVRTGAYFISYAHEKTVTNATIFLILLTQHLIRHGIDLSETVIQTDNGSEFTTPWNSIKRSAFTLFIEEMLQAKHVCIPPGAKTWQSDVETAHRIIEDEFYCYEVTDSYPDFFHKAYQYMLEFNLRRYNSYKEGSPEQIMRECLPDHDPHIFDFKPVLLDPLLDVYKEEFRIPA